jgi:hypothetical protein
MVQLGKGTPPDSTTLTLANHFGGDVAEAVDAKQLAVVGAEDQLQQPTVTGDCPACGGGQVAAADYVGDAGGVNLLFGRPDAGDLGQAVDGAARGLIDRHAEHQSAGVSRCRTPLLHRDRGERRLEHITSRVNPSSGRPVVAVDDDPPFRIVEWNARVVRRA